VTVIKLYCYLSNLVKCRSRQAVSIFTATSCDTAHTAGTRSQAAMLQHSIASHSCKEAESVHNQTVRLVPCRQLLLVLLLEVAPRSG
jgi:hypothetical protein